MPDYVRLLEAGINVVSTTSTSLVYPPAYYAPEWRDQMEAAAKSGNASFYASGIFPGFGSDQLALLLTTQSKKIRCITVTEVALNDHYPVADVMMDGMGFGRPLDFEPMLKTPGSSKWLGRHRSISSRGPRSRGGGGAWLARPADH